MKAKVHITLKNGVLDPQGAAITAALSHLGFDGITQARVGKYIEIELDATDRDKAEATVSDMCKKLLANTVVEKYAIELVA